MKRFLLLFVFLGLFAAPTAAQEETLPSQPYVVLPGDTWAALAARFHMSRGRVQALSGHVNLQREPVIGAVIQVPSSEPENGRLLRPVSGGLVSIAFRYHLSPWSLAIRNGLSSPYLPLQYAPLFLPGGTQLPLDLPLGFETLELSQLVATPGVALAVRALTTEHIDAQFALEDRQFGSFSEGDRVIGLVATGAFFGSGEPELSIQPEGAPRWSQPWRFQDGEWTFQQITLTGEAAAIDQESIAQERARLFELWSVANPTAEWDSQFGLPVTDFLGISSEYGARRSYNGGPYGTYHEGVDFSAYGGTAVYAPAQGVVALAEKLYVRGGAVILDHGLGVYTGYYHLSEVTVAAGQHVQKGDQLGEVGTTGLSTGNHLHWDMLVDSTWVDARAWIDSDLACWILEGLGRACLAD